MGPARAAAGGRRVGIAAEATKPVEDVPGPDTLPADRALARYVLRVRERAYGWPGGVSPWAATSGDGV